MFAYNTIDITYKYLQSHNRVEKILISISEECKIIKNIGFVTKTTSKMMQYFTVMTRLIPMFINI